MRAGATRSVVSFEEPPTGTEPAGTPGGSCATVAWTHASDGPLVVRAGGKVASRFELFVKDEACVEQARGKGDRHRGLGLAETRKRSSDGRHGHSREDQRVADRAASDRR